MLVSNQGSWFIIHASFSRINPRGMANRAMENTNILIVKSDDCIGIECWNMFSLCGSLSRSWTLPLMRKYQNKITLKRIKDLLRLQ